MPVFVLGSHHHHINHELLEDELINCDVKSFDWEKEPLVENSLIFADPCLFNLQHLTESQVQQAKTIVNKRVLLVYDYKSFYSNSHMIRQVHEALSAMNFNFSEVYIITQLEYDSHAIKNVMPEVNVVSRDRWLKELFKIQVTPRVFGEFDIPKLEKPVLFDIPKKRFSIFIRRFNQTRFEFMCGLLAMGLESQMHCTFANTESTVTIDDLKTFIPKRLESSRALLENWIEGVPYTVEKNHQYDHVHYPLNLRYYFEKSDIHIVYETEPYGSDTVYSGTGYGSFLTEKTYKAILFKKPFVIVTEQHGLKALRAAGFKTFSPYIDESYDDIEDFDLRVGAVLTEIQRLSLLSNEEMTKILQDVNEIIKHNHKVLYDLAYTSLPDQFKLKSLLTF